MEPARVLSRPWLRTLWLRPHQILRAASNSSDRSRLNTWEQRVGQFADKLTPELDENRPKEDLAKKLRDLLDTQIERQSSNPTLHTHFNQLFAGLDTLSEPPAPLHLKEGLSPDRTESDILKWFDKFYYQGKISLKVALAVLKDPRVKHIDQLVHQINNGGILIRWSKADKHFFQLNVANKYWRLGQRDLARQYVYSDFDTYWMPELESDSLSPSRLSILLRAVVATQPSLALDVAQTLTKHQHFCALYILWANAVTFKQWQVANAVIYGASSNTLFQALALVTDEAQLHGIKGMEPLLKIVPRRKDLQHHISVALMEVANTHPELGKPLAEKLAALEADEVTEARIAAFRLSLN